MQKKKLLSIVLLFAVACTNEDKIVTEQKQDIYLEYTISGEEDLNYVTCLVHFFGDSYKTKSLLLAPPAKISLDGEPLTPDSTEYTGVYYEIRKPLKSFGGQHTILFSNSNMGQHKETFTYTPFKLANTFNNIGKKDLVLEIKGLKNGDVVRTILLDTSFDSKGIDERDTIKNNKIIIPVKKIQTLEKGPIILQLIKEDEKDLTNGFKKVGHILINYSLKRELELNN